MKHIYFFHKDIDKNASPPERHIVGNKGRALYDMSAMGIKVPAGFTISTDVSTLKKKAQANIVNKDILSAIDRLEKLTGKSFGDKNNPLLVSVRSGAIVSMPGMLDTILNVGLNDKIVSTLNTKFIIDCYKRLITMYANVILSVNPQHFAKCTSIDEYKKTFFATTNQEFPEDCKTQLLNSIEAVFRSWHNSRAKTYRRLNNISEELGTAVNIQEMVFGNMNSNSLTGVVFSRNPSTGEDQLYGEYLYGVQGEDIVAGHVTPLLIQDLKRKDENLFIEITRIAKLLENAQGDVQEIEFTVENGKLWILQTRNAKRTANAALKIALDTFKSNPKKGKKLIHNIDINNIGQSMHPIVKEFKDKDIISRGLAASPGAALGKVALDTMTAIKYSTTNSVILLRNETSPEDIEGISVSDGVITVRGGMTSHAAVVTRGMGKACITNLVGCDIDLKKREFKIGNLIFKEGDILTIDGNRGLILKPNVKLHPAENIDNLKELLKTISRENKIQIRANADSNEELENALLLSADGIGLCRTEHMFFSPERIKVLQSAIINSTKKIKDSDLKELSSFQLTDFNKLFLKLNNKPITIRLLDPPLHEFLPKTEIEVEESANHLKVKEEKILQIVKNLSESNPMLGHRGCRLGITTPELYEMQISSIFKAMHKAKRTEAVEIMVPFISNEREIFFFKDMLIKENKKAKKRYNRNFKYLLGSMIELPAAVLNIEKIAAIVDFCSFGTNDLTQMTLGLSRDDSSKFMQNYIKNKIFSADPFLRLEDSVLKLLEIGIKNARKVSPKIKIGVCGEHANIPQTLKKLYELGVNYVSASPYKIPGLIIAAYKLST